MNMFAKFLSAVALVAVCSSAHAEKFFNEPQIEPGPVLTVDPASLEVANVLLKALKSTPVEAKQFVDSGNIIKEVTVQHYAPGVSSYTFLNRECMVGGFAGGTCIGGAQLRVTLTRVQNGSMPTEKVESHISLIRSLVR